MVGGRFIRLDAKGGGWVSIDPSLVRAVVGADGGGSLIWFGHGHEIVVKDEPEVVSRRLEIDGRAASG